MTINTETILQWMTAVTFALYLWFIFACLVQLRRGRRYDSPHESQMPVGEWPSVTILKPCAGSDDDLESCLESYFTVRYPNTQLLFGVRSESDPALAVIERVRAKYPQMDSAVFVTGEGSHVSPKISQMEFLAHHAKHDYWWLSDSNTKVHPDTLWDMMAKLRVPGSGLVASPVVGDGERTMGSALENLQQNCYVVLTTYALKFSLARVAVPGKSMLVTKEALLKVGGWNEIGQYFADDEVLIQSMMAHGYKTHLGTLAVQNVNCSGDVKKFYHRHLRWSQIRWRVVPHGTVMELLFMAPIHTTLLYFLLLPSLQTAGLFALGVLTQCGLDYLVAYAVRGRGIEPRYWGVVLLRPYINVLLVIRGLFSGHVAWRGNDLWMGPRAKILTEPAYRRGLRALRSAIKGGA
jgi:ceramide glucosyltransferase